MENQNKNYISLFDAAKLTPYPAGYLSLLSRKGKLKAEKIGKSWFTTEEWVKEYLVSVQKDNLEKGNGSISSISHGDIEDKNDDEFLTVAEAEKICQYSGTYLSLRIRQGKLKGKKLGRNWHTKKEWIEEYVKSFASESKAEPIKSEDINKEAIVADKENKAVEQSPDENVNTSMKIVAVEEIAAEFSFAAKFLIRQIEKGNLEGKNIAGNWYTRHDWVTQFVGAQAKDKIDTQKSSGVLSVLKRTLQLFITTLKPTTTKVISSALVLTIAFAFIASPSIWAKWIVNFGYASAYYGAHVSKQASITTKHTMKNISSIVHGGIQVASGSVEYLSQEIVGDQPQPTLQVLFNENGQVAGAFVERGKEDNNHLINKSIIGDIFKIPIESSKSMFSVFDPSEDSSLVSRISTNAQDLVGNVVGVSIAEKASSVINHPFSPTSIGSWLRLDKRLRIPVGIKHSSELIVE